jgi:hypothetical protein
MDDFKLLRKLHKLLIIYSSKVLQTLIESLCGVAGLNKRPLPGTYLSIVHGTHGDSFMP